MAKPQAVIAIYRVKATEEERFMELLERHHPALLSLGLVTEEPPTIYRGEEDGQPIVFEIFSWKSAKSPGLAHQLPEVMAIWEPMGTLVEERDGKPKMQFPHVEPVVFA